MSTTAAVADTNDFILSLTVGLLDICVAATTKALYWQVPGYKRGPGRPTANWRGVISKDLRKMGFTWEEAEVAALDRHGWRRSVAQCVQLDTG